jgi:hypothetical protein
MFYKDKLKKKFLFYLFILYIFNYFIRFIKFNLKLL